MIRIRYADLPEGLHARLEAQGRRKVIYLRPALSTAQRRDALHRVRRAAQLGSGPPLPASGVWLAVAMDIGRSTARNGMTAIRCHPVGSLFLTALLASVMVCYTFFVSVSIQLIPAPPAKGALPAVGGGTGRVHVQPPSAARSGGPGVTAPAAVSSPGGVASPRASARAPAGAPAGPPGGAPGGPPAGASVSAAASASARAAVRPVGPGPSRPAPSPVPLPSSPAQSASPSPGPTGASPAPSGSSAGPGGLCVDVGPLGVCLSV